MWNFYYATTENNTKPETLGEGIFQTLDIGQVDIVHQRVVTRYTDEGFRGLSEKGWNVMGDWRQLKSQS